MTERPTPPATPRALATTKDVAAWEIVAAWLASDPANRFVEVRALTAEKIFAVVHDGMDDREALVEEYNVAQAALRGLQELSQRR